VETDPSEDDQPEQNTPKAEAPAPEQPAPDVPELWATQSLLPCQVRQSAQEMKESE